MKPSLSIFFPAYNDAGTIASLALVAHMTARQITDDYEVIVVNDASPDHTGELLEEMARTYPWLKVVHHPANRGYGGALRSGFAAASKDLVFYTDGDAQYDPRELLKLYEAFTPGVDFVNGIKIARSDPLHRKLIGRLYHTFVKTMFGLRLRDVDCDFRLMRRAVFEKVTLTRSSGVICVELMKKVQDHGFRIAEVPVHHFHRAYGRSQFFNVPRVARTLADLVNLWLELVVRKEHLRGAPCARRGEILNHLDFYRGRKVMVTGALGFIGSNLCRTLADLGAAVLAVDSLLPDYGGNLFNLAGYEDKVRINIADVRGHAMEYLVRGQEVLFNLAGQVSHIDSMTDPFTDLEINCRSQLWILEAVRKNNPGVKMVYAGTRQVYGKPKSLPVDETHLLNPTDVNGINKISGEFYHLVYHSVYGIRASSLRLTNTYGPRQLIRHAAPGLHRVVRAPGRARRGDPALRRRRAEARLRLRGRRGGRVPARGVDGRRGRAGLQPRRRGAGLAARPREDDDRDRGAGLVQRGPLPARAGAHRHRRLLRRRHQDPRTRSAGSRGSGCATGSRARSTTTAKHKDHYL